MYDDPFTLGPIRLGRPGTRVGDDSGDGILGLLFLGPPRLHLHRFGKKPAMFLLQLLHGGSEECHVETLHLYLYIPNHGARGRWNTDG
ncbi:hypothetical protein Ct61P_15515 [Colletotrichum tofieldiae]|nr:hypothetical protein Ct61P_15515 [Colletotrichum tofieldiae]